MKYAHIIMALAIAIAALVWLAWGVREAFSHSWYDRACCSNRDCEAMPPGSVEDLGRNKGYRVRFTSEIWKRPIDVMVPYSLKKDSQDGQDHFCGRPDAGSIRPLCLYLTVNT